MLALINPCKGLAVECMLPSQPVRSCVTCVKVRDAVTYTSTADVDLSLSYLTF